MSPKASTIDEYIKCFPEDVQMKLEELRTLIKSIVPEAEETIKYAMPTFTLNGNLAHFAAFKNHIGFYPVPSNTEKFREELSQFKTGKGSVQFPLNEPLPLALISKLVKFQIENLQKANVTKKQKRII